MAPMCQSVQYSDTQSYQIQMSHACYYMPVYHDKILIINIPINLILLSTIYYAVTGVCMCVRVHCQGAA